MEDRYLILVEPEKPENTGFIARLCSNFNYSLRLVKPAFNLQEARKTASNAQEKLRDAKIFDSLEQALSGVPYAVGTKPDRGSKIGDFKPNRDTSIVIGPESSGLSNEQLELCDATVHIPTKDYQSINQSHAAGIIMHEFYEEDSKKSIEEGQKNVLNKILPETIFETILQSNPSREKVDRMIGELKNR